MHYVYCVQVVLIWIVFVISGKASGHAGHAEHDQKYSRVKNFFTCLKMEVWFEICFKKSHAALVNYAVGYVHWWPVASHAHLR